MTHVVQINQVGEVLLAGNAGTGGQVITSAGPGAPVVWGSGGGGSASLVLKLDGNSSVQMPYNGTDYTDWATITTVVSSSDAQWDSSSPGVKFNREGYYKITVISTIFPNNSGLPLSWPDNLTQFGSKINGVESHPDHSRHSTYVNSGAGIDFNNIASITSAPVPNTAIFTDSYIIRADIGAVMMPAVYAATSISV